MNKAKRTKRRVYFGILFWIGYWLMITFIISINAEWQLALRRATVISLIHLGISSINLYWMIPQFFIRKKYWNYVLIGLCLVWVIWFLQVSLFESLMKPNGVEVTLMKKFETKILRWSSTIMVLAASTAYKVILINNEKEKELTLLKNEKLEQEKAGLSYKNLISFNHLNSVAKSS